MLGHLFYHQSLKNIVLRILYFVLICFILLGYNLLFNKSIKCTQITGRLRQYKLLLIQHTIIVLKIFNYQFIILFI